MRKVKKYKDYDNGIGELDMLKKSWQEIEDKYPWDFDYFWNKIYTYSNDYEHRYNGNGNYDYEICVEFYKGNPSFIEKDLDWRKRNGYIMVKTSTGGYTGGSCWDDSDPQPYSSGNEVEYQDLKNFIEHILYYIFGKNHAFADIPELLKKLDASSIIHEDIYTEYEYYGNSTDYQWYEVKLWDLYQFLAKEESF